MPRVVPVLDSYLYPRHAGYAPLSSAVVNIFVHGVLALKFNHMLGGAFPFVLMASFFSVHGWMAFSYKRDPFCEYAWKAWLMPADFRYGPTFTGPRRSLLWKRTRNLGSSCGRRFET
jgi:hypothetical protein